ncbi:GerAB/ArcD/ProY family transporter [Paenibacillus mendelii]|uniref:GerAB/ArcD/ProY family transporter n=1 Tax=Paenibacillus mendelii TaxID=206163 RepID=A0ABV6JGU8_9BACL|nr:GerAB/ArcD/ProY family transporter [Paenibacillus mendelii]MCQ6557982.1 spore germination protein [Paenibacillus mendelii]
MGALGKYQIVVMTVMFELGSTPLFELGIEAKQDAWLAMLFASLAGLVLTWIYLRIQLRFPSYGLNELLRAHLGRILGAAVSLLFAVYFIYEASRNVRDFSELTVMTILQQTPQWIIIAIVCLIGLYAAWKGTTVFFRVVELLFPIVFVSYAFILLLLIVSRLSNYHRLLPMLEHGVAPVLNAAFPDIVSFPFGQMVVFLVFWHRVKENKRLGRAAVWAYIVVAFFLTLMNALTISILGPEIASISSLPLLEVVQLIRFASFLERVDVFVTLLLYIGLYVKMTLFYMAAILVVNGIFPKSYRTYAVVIIVLIAAMAFLEPDHTTFIWIGLTVSVKIFPLFQIVIPLLLLVIGALRGLGSNKGVDGGAAAEK